MMTHGLKRFSRRFFWGCLMLLSLCPLWTAEIADEQVEYFDGSTLIAGAFLPPIRHDELRGEGEANYLGKNEALEATLVDGWARLAAEIDVSGYKLAKADLGNYYINILCKHGEIFHVNSTNWGIVSSGGVVIKVRPQYTVTDAAALAEMKAELEQAVQNALSLVSDNMSDLEKALVLHDFVCSNCEYDETASLSHIRDAYGALVLKRAVCAGYAISYAHLLRKVGVPVDYIASDSMNHAWNAVYIDGEWYHVDVTWDDPVTSGYSKPEKFYHENFLKSDTAIKSLEHPVWDYPLYVCNSTRFDDYFWNDEESFASGAVPCFAGRGYAVSKTKNELYAYDLETGQGEKVLDLPDVRWNVWGKPNSYWTGKFYQLATFHGLLAISTRDSVLLCDPDTMATTTLTADLPDTGYCYGLWLSDGANLYAVIRQSPGGESAMLPLPWVPVTQVTVAPATQEYDVLNAGGTQSLQLSAMVAPANASWQVLTWSSDNEAVATVDSHGQATISLAAPGTATIYATSRENISGQCDISVDYPPIAITVTGSSEVGGQVSGGGVFDYGTTTTLTAVPAEDYLFSGWFLNDELVSSEESYAITAYADADYLALFTLKTYAVTTTGCLADKSVAARGETVMVTATLPDGALVSDYDIEWIFAPAVEFTTGDGTASFEMPAEAVEVNCVATLKTYGVTATGGTADKLIAARGEMVTMTALLPEEALVSDYDFAWSSVPTVEFTVNEGTAFFTMPAEAVSVTCSATPKTYTVMVSGATADKSSATRGETVTVTATLPEDSLASDYDIEWTSVPTVEFTEGDGTASFTMPTEAVSVSCVTTLKTYAITVTGATADKSSANRGETVTVTALLPEDALVSDYDFEWTFAPSIEFAEGEGMVSFEMPTEAVEVTCVATLKTYVVTANGCTADKEIAARGETVMVTAMLPEGTSATDFDLSWESVPEVDFIEIDAGVVRFVMPASEIAVTCTGALDLYPVTVVGATAKKSYAAAGEMVTATATLPDGALVSDYDIEWTLTPSVDFTTGEGTASFEMPDEAVAVTCVAMLKTYAVTVDGCTADKETAPRGETVTATATLPDGALVSDYDFAWSFAPSIEFTTGEGTASFEMPAAAVEVNCVATLKTYAVTVEGCTSDKETAPRGETVMATAILPEDALVSDYDFEWTSVPVVEFAEGEGSASFEMPTAAVSVTCVATLKTYEITTEGCAVEKALVPRGEMVTATATLPDGALVSDYDIEWTLTPSVDFTTGEGTASFEMPDEAVAVTCVAMLKTYAVTVDGCTADKETAPRGEAVTVIATFPEDEEAEFWDFTWSSVPPVEFSAVDELTMSFAMPAEAVTVTCALSEKPMENTATQRVLQLSRGWNPVVLSLIPDEPSVERLGKFQAMVWDDQNQIYTRAQEFSADGLYWVYALAEKRVVVTGEAFSVPMPQDGGWRPYGAFEPEFPLDGYEVWLWERGVFQGLENPQIVPGKGYFLRKRQ